MKFTITFEIDDIMSKKIQKMTAPLLIDEIFKGVNKYWWGVLEFEGDSEKHRIQIVKNFEVNWDPK